MKDFYINHLEYKTINDMAEFHTHKTFELYYQVLGSRNYDINHASLPVKKGDFIFIYPHTPHLTTSSDEIFYERILINMDPHFFGEWEKRFGGFQLLNLPMSFLKLSFYGADRKHITRLLYTLLEEYRKEDSNQILRIQALLIELFITLERQLNIPEPASSGQANSSWLVSNVCEYIQEHYDKPLTLQSLADHFYISPYTLSRKFNTYTALSVPQYINLIRIDNIKEIFQTDTETSLTDIIMHQGFNSLSHFNKVFKKMENISPTEYRNHIHLN